jgi:hypothetical protein
VRRKRKDSTKKNKRTLGELELKDIRVLNRSETIRQLQGLLFLLEKNLETTRVLARGVGLAVQGEAVVLEQQVEAVGHSFLELCNNTRVMRQTATTTKKVLTLSSLGLLIQEFNDVHREVGHRQVCVNGSEIQHVGGKKIGDRQAGKRGDGG